MSYKVVAIAAFEKELKRLTKKYPSLKQQYIQLVNELKKNPEMGKPIGNHCFKIRLAIESKNKGKRSGARVITQVFVTSTVVYLLSIYDKSEQADIGDNDLQRLIDSIN